jgi:hypothetical protein
MSDSSRQQLDEGCHPGRQPGAGQSRCRGVRGLRCGPGRVDRGRGRGRAGLGERERVRECGGDQVPADQRDRGDPRDQGAFPAGPRVPGAAGRRLRRRPGLPGRRPGGRPGLRRRPVRRPRLLRRRPELARRSLRHRPGRRPGLRARHVDGRRLGGRQHGARRLGCRAHPLRRSRRDGRGGYGRTRYPRAWAYSEATHRPAARLIDRRSDSALATSCTAVSGSM